MTLKDNVLLYWGIHPRLIQRIRRGTLPKIVEEVETEYWGASEAFYHVECKFLGRAFAKTVFFSVNFMVNEDPDTGRDYGAKYELQYPELSEEDVYNAYAEALEAGEWQGEDGKMTPRSLFAWAEEHGLADKEICYEITADYKGGYGRSHMGFPYFSERDDVIVFMTNGE